MKVLVVKMSSLGDVIHTLPALTDAAAAIPGIRFDWVVEEAFAEIPGWHAAVDTVIPVAVRRWRRHPLRDFRGSQWRKARTDLGRKHYDAVIDAQGLVKSAFIARLVKATRYGLDLATVRERLACSVYHHRIHVPKEQHAVTRTRQLFAKALHYDEPESAADYGLREGAFRPAVQPSRSLMFFHGTARAEKLWPEESWIELARRAAANGYRVALPWGSELEYERAQRIELASAAVDAVYVLPKLNLAGVASTLGQCRGAVAVDTGLGHLAAALSVPCVSLYGPTQPKLIGALGEHQAHLVADQVTGQATGARTAMSTLTAESVWGALEMLLCEDTLPSEQLQQTRVTK